MTNAMKRVRHAAAATLSVALLIPGSSWADDQDVIDYRGHVMKTMEQQVAAIERILQKKAPAEHLVKHVEILAMTATTAKSAFTPNVPGGEAKTDVWSKWPDFAKRLDELTAATAELLKTAQQGGAAATASKLPTALNCKGCHDLYRAESKK